MWQRSAFLLAAIAFLTWLGFVIYRAQSAPGGPQAIAWDSENCSECHMLISDRSFAAQFQDGGQAINFDSPACLMAYLKRRHPHVDAIYFGDSESGRWLKSEEAGFVRGAQGPMGNGLAAVPKTTPGTLSFTQAFREISQGHSAKGGM